MSYPAISSRVAEVRERIDAACKRSGRPADAVTIVVVTKNHPESAIVAVRDAGLADIGENRVQEMEAKFESLGRLELRWHLIGHLQRNKARKAIEIADLIHSIDSVRIARKLSEEAVSAGRNVEGLIQVNLGGEETKGGLEPPEAMNGIAEICALPGLKITGLMTIAPLTDYAGRIRSVFQNTRSLHERAADEVAGYTATHLSMGMSGDFEIAVEEGSTLVRLGTVLLGERST